jgi:hypothetical protein
LLKKRKNDIVFNYGDFGREFYVILRGKVAVKVPTQVNVKGRQADYYNYLIDNYQDVIWKKTEGGEAIKTFIEYDRVAKLSGRSTP